MKYLKKIMDKMVYNIQLLRSYSLSLFVVFFPMLEMVVQTSKKANFNFFIEPIGLVLVPLGVLIWRIHQKFENIHHFFELSLSIDLNFQIIHSFKEV